MTEYSDAGAAEAAMQAHLRAYRLDRQYEARQEVLRQRRHITWAEARCVFAYNFFQNTWRNMNMAVVTDEQVYQGMTAPMLELTQ